MFLSMCQISDKKMKFYISHPPIKGTLKTNKNIKTKLSIMGRQRLGVVEA